MGGRKSSRATGTDELADLGRAGEAPAAGDSRVDEIRPSSLAAEWGDERSDPGTER